MAKLSKDVFLALAAIGWADGQLDANEAAGILRAAREEGLDDAALAEVKAATETKRELTTIDRKALSAVERTFVYATAIWLARIDGFVDPGEREALHKLGHLLHIPDRVRTEASAAALEVAQSSGDKPDKYDLGKLRERVADRLDALAKHLAEE